MTAKWVLLNWQVELRKRSRWFHWNRFWNFWFVKSRTLGPHPSRVLLELNLVFQVSRIWKEMCGDWCSSFSEPWQEQRRVPDEKWNVKIASKSDKRTGEYDRKPSNKLASSVDATNPVTRVSDMSGGRVDLITPSSLPTLSWTHYWLTTHPSTDWQLGDTIASKKAT